jgi:hypothetical protein
VPSRPVECCCCPQSPSLCCLSCIRCRCRLRLVWAASALYYCYCYCYQLSSAINSFDPQPSWTRQAARRGRRPRERGHRLSSAMNSFDPQPGGGDGTQCGRVCDAPSTTPATTAGAALACMHPRACICRHPLPVLTVGVCARACSRPADCHERPADARSILIPEPLCDQPDVPHSSCRAPAAQ